MSDPFAGADPLDRALGLLALIAAGRPNAVLYNQDAKALLQELERLRADRRRLDAIERGEWTVGANGPGDWYVDLGVGHYEIMLADDGPLGLRAVLDEAIEQTGILAAQSAATAHQYRDAKEAADA